MRSRRVRIGTVIVCSAAVGVMALPSGAGAAGRLSGYRSEATGRAVSVSPFLPSLFPYVDSPVEATFGLGYSNVVSSATAFARAAPVWPGTVLAGLGPLLGVAGAPAQIAGAIPPYPMVAEAHADSGEVDNTAVPFATMRAFGSPQLSRADTKLPDFSLPGVLTVDSIATHTETAVTDTNVSAKSSVTLQGISLAGGQISIGTLRSTSMGTSDASVARTGGGVKLVDVVVGGVPASVDETGVHAEGQSVSPGVDANQQLSGALASLGASMTLIGTNRSVAGALADATSGGVLIAFNTPAAGPVPAGKVFVILGSTAIDVNANPSYDVASLTAPVPFPSGGDTSGLGTPTEVAGLQLTAPFGTPTPAPAPALAAGGATAGAAAGPATASSTTAPAYHFGGIPRGLLLLLMAVTWIGAVYLRRFVRLLMAIEE